MVSRVYHVNKKTGVTYVYESTSYWDKNKKQARNKQVCIGKLDSITQELIPSKRLMPAQTPVGKLPVTASAEIVGPSIVLDHITHQLGLDKLLKSCFPDSYQQILTMAYYLTSRGDPLSHCETWCKGHAPSLTASLTSQRISELLGSIGTDAKQTFFTKWTKKVVGEDQLCYDITSVSSYSECNEYIKFGHNRDREQLPQLNLALLFGQQTGLPVYYQRLPGSISDVSTLQNLLKTFKLLEIPSIQCVMDKGFYSKKNIDGLFVSKHKFTIAVPLSNKWLQQAIDDVQEDIHGPSGYRKIDGETLYVHSRLYPWGQQNRRCYLHLYYNAHARAAAVDEFNGELIEYRKELESEQLIPLHQEAYERFFIVKITPKRGRQVEYNEQAIKQYISRYTGFQALLTNSIKDPIQALRVYRDKDVVEKSFDDLKNQLDMRRLRMHQSITTDGRLFIQFIALIYMSALRRAMRQSDWLGRYTVRELLEEMETLTKVRYSGKYGHILTEVTKAQRGILEALKIPLPSLA